jgi:hypothetical protein
MVSFVCDKCAGTFKKAKVAQHSYSCGSHYYSCIDCGFDFDTESIKAHNSCVSEAEKYQGALFKGKKVGAPAKNPVAPPLPAGQKAKRHHLDSSSDEEEEAAAPPPPAKKAKHSPVAAPTPAPVAAVAAARAAAAAFDLAASVQSLLASKGTLSLKKLRKAVIKAAGASAEKEALTTQLLATLLEHSGNVNITWSAKDEE